MSNPDIPKQDRQQINSLNDYLINNKVCLFNFSKIKTQRKLTLSHFNTFNYDLSGNELYYTKNDKINPISEVENNRYIKNINIEIPSSEKLSNEEYKTSFINEYDESFPSFCGLNKDQFTKIYLNNNNRPSVDELGDINIYIKNIAEVLEDFSEKKRLKICRRAHKRNRMKKGMKVLNSNLAQNKAKNIFHIFQSDKMEKNEKDNSHYELIEKEKMDNNNDNEEIIKNIQNTPSLSSENNNDINTENIKENENKNEKKKQKTLSNIKKKLKNISIPTSNKKQLKLKDNSSNHSRPQYENKNNLNEQKIHSCKVSSSNTNNFIFKDNNINDSSKKIIMDNNKTPDILNNHNSLSNLSFPHNLNSANNNNNIFDFSANVINLSEGLQSKSKNDIPIKQILSPFNINNNSLNLSSYNNMNNNTPFNRPVLSPMNYSPDIGYGINNVISPCLPKSNINSPFLINVSPFNNNNFFNDHFAFNNVNTTSFFFGNNENNNDNKNENKNNDNPSIEGNINFNNNENIENNNNIEGNNNEHNNDNINRNNE